MRISSRANAHAVFDNSWRAFKHCAWVRDPAQTRCARVGSSGISFGNTGSETFLLNPLEKVVFANCPLSVACLAGAFKSPAWLQKYNCKAPDSHIAWTDKLESWFLQELCSCHTAPMHQGLDMMQPVVTLLTNCVIKCKLECNSLQACSKVMLVIMKMLI